MKDGDGDEDGMMEWYNTSNFQQRSNGKCFNLMQMNEKKTRVLRFFAGHLIYERQDRRATATIPMRILYLHQYFAVVVDMLVVCLRESVCCILNHINPSLYYVSISSIKDKNRLNFFILSSSGFFVSSFLKNRFCRADRRPNDDDVAC